jgi:hypothetical protein
MLQTSETDQQLFRFPEEVPSGFTWESYGLPGRVEGLPAGSPVHEQVSIPLSIRRNE